MKVFPQNEETVLVLSVFRETFEDVQLLQQVSLLVSLEEKRKGSEERGTQVSQAGKIDDKNHVTVMQGIVQGIVEGIVKGILQLGNK